MRYFWILGAVVSTPAYFGLCLDGLTRVFASVYAVGVDVRRVSHDGWPVAQIIATDLVPGMTLSRH